VKKCYLEGGWAIPKDLEGDYIINMKGKGSADPFFIGGGAKRNH